MAVKNKYTGETPVTIGGKTYTLVYNWTALAALETEFKKEQIQSLDQQNPQALAKMLVIGLQEKHPDITEDLVMKSSPVVMDIVKAIDTALLYSYHGPEKAKEILDNLEKIENALKGTQTAGASKKKK